MSAFPSDLPLPSIDGFSIAPDKAFVRTDMESGPARQRRRFTAVPSRATVTWKFSKAQMVTFKAFFEATIAHGADWFQLVLDIGDGLLTYDVRFVEPYSANYLPAMGWSVGANIEVRAA